MFTTEAINKGNKMSELDIKAIEANFEGWKRERAPRLSNDKAFERFVVEQVLKDAELSDEEISSGILGGQDDGGIDSMYFFVNRVLIDDETEMPDPALTAELVLIQAKYELGFGENTIEQMYSFTRDLLDYSKPVDSLTYLNSIAKDTIARFREKYNAILASQHSLTVKFCYAIRGDTAPHPKVTKRVENLKAFVREQLSAAQVEFEFWGAARLLTAARTSPRQRMSINITKHFQTKDRAVVCLVTLKDFADFLKDEHGTIRRSLLEPNVRDYQGKRNLVNADIRATLENADSTEFWWLNNGVTILAADSFVAGDTLTIDKPEIVNGLQTSQEIFAYFKDNPDRQDTRTVLIRVIAPPEEQTRTKITKATNFQTPVNPVSLHATDPIHFDIEEKFKLYGLFYDRRKGHYRNLRKPISQIISIHDLARAVIAIVLRLPNDARGGPQKLLNNDSVYKQIFNEHYNRDLYVASILLHRQVEEYLNRNDQMSKDERRDIKYYVELLLACELTQSANPSPSQIASLVPMLVNSLTDELIDTACKEALREYNDLGGIDKVAKGIDLRTRLLYSLNSRFHVSSKT